MDPITMLVDLVIVLWFLAVIVAIVRVVQTREPRLAPISAETHNQFVTAWRRATGRFVQSPRDAAEEADAIVLSLLRERGRPVRQDRLPRSVAEARGWLAREGTSGTEALRQAMLHYRVIFEGTIGRHPQEEASARRREMA